MKNKTMSFIKYQIQNGIVILILLLGFQMLNAQQDPQYTQYMYNTMGVNPAYAGTRDMISVAGLHRSQWVGLDGAPRTQTLGLEMPLKENMGLGLSVISDALGPANENSIDANFSYRLKFEEDKHLAFGLKAGLRFFDVDFSKGTPQQQNDLSLTNISSELMPTAGLGIYYYTDKWYTGLSVPNLLKSDHYDEIQQAVASEQLHFFLIAGYVFDINEDLKFKPAALGKIVTGTPISVDLSANFLIKEKLTLGIGYRWDDALNALAGFQVSDKMFIGYAYDYTTSNLNDYSNGSHEIMLRFDLIKPRRRLKSPRFF